MEFEYVTTNGRFVHKRLKDEKNSICGAVPNYYIHGKILIFGDHEFKIGGKESFSSLTEQEANKLHRCKKCFDPEYKPFRQKT